MKKTAFILFLLPALLLSGCELKSNIMGPENMTPRLITIGDDLSTPELVDSVKPAVVGISATVSGGYSVGSGVAIASGGYILTNHHVVENSSKIRVYFADNTDASAKKLWSDSALDLAIIRSSVDLPYLETSPSSTLEVGEDVIAIGTPLTLQFKHTVTKGIVSALGRTLEIGELGGTTTLMQNLIQHDASINPGNSGGPLINSAGKVVGINTLKASDAEGIAFAIPIEVATAVTGKIIQNASYKTPYLGMYGYDSALAKFEGVTTEKSGVYVGDVQAKTCFENAGIKKGDIIVELDGTKISSMLDLRCKLFSLDEGQTVLVKYLRDGNLHEAEITLCCKQI